MAPTAHKPSVNAAKCAEQVPFVLVDMLGYRISLTGPVEIVLSMNYLFIHKNIFRRQIDRHCCSWRKNQMQPAYFFFFEQVFPLSA